MSEQSENLIKLKSDDFEIQYEILPMYPNGKRRAEICIEIDSIDEKLSAMQQRVDELNVDIDRLTNHADGLDYAVSISAGIITGIIDSIFVGKWDFATAKAISNEEINNKVIDFAKGNPKYIGYCKRNGKDPNRLDSAIGFLQGEYKLPGDGDYKHFKSTGTTDATHHLDDFCHHPTLIGLICSCIVQFTGTARYSTSSGSVIKVPIEVNKYGKFVSNTTGGKIFSGIINWFFAASQTINNYRGHLYSDMAGSLSSVQKGNYGAGIPGTVISTLKELSALPCFSDTAFPENLRKAFQNGIGSSNKKLDLGPFNALFEGASSKLDMRTEMAVSHELKRQSVSIIINELLVRGLYFIRRFISEMKEKRDIAELDWRKVLPFNNRTINRMLTISTGTFMAVDMVDAAVRGAVNSGGNGAVFAKEFILRVNFVGVGRFAVAVGTDIGMGIKRARKESERRALYSEMISLTNAKMFYSEADMWISMVEAGEALNEAYEEKEKAVRDFAVHINEISNDIDSVTGQIATSFRNNNAEAIDELLDILEF